MKTKPLFLMFVVLFMSFLTACGGGGSSSGGGVTTAGTFVGTWNRVAFTGDGAGFPEQLIFNTNGTGSYSGNTSGSANFTWNHSGNQLSITENGRTQTITAPAVGSVGNSVTLTTTTGGTATYNRV